MDNAKLEELGYDMIIGRDLLLSLGITQILDAHYEKANIVETSCKNCSHLSKNKQNKIINLLKKV